MPVTGLVLPVLLITDDVDVDTGGDGSVTTGRQVYEYPPP